MTELARLDAIASNQAKASFVASISHELRSPLHGILGNLQFLQESPLDSFQIAMLGSMAACGRTLLDTLNHVLDYAKLPEVKRNASTIRLKDTKTILLSSKPLRNRQLGYSHSQEVAFDLAQATEEVVEAVFAGQAYGVFSDAFKEGLKDSSDATPDKRKDCFIVLNIAQEDDWDFVVPPGSWRRIVMNIFGNALKYTDSGQISISLRASERRNDVNTPRNIVLTITDSGSGMSPQFLANKVFQPFSQENPHATGTGLGLSIVRQMIESIGGKVEINSDTDWGTKTTVKLPLARAERGKAKSPEWSRFSAALPRLMGRRICLLRTEYPPNATTLNRFADNLASTLTDWLKMEVVQTSEWEGHDADFVICPEPSFDYLTTIRRQRATGTNAPVTIFIAMDALEASTLRSDARIVSKESVVEIMTQP
jgi:signal transduction histidine kinase